MESSQVSRRQTSRIIFLLTTLTLTLAASGFLCGAIMSDYWEEINWDKDVLTDALGNNDINPTWYLDGKVVMLRTLSSFKSNNIEKELISFLVPMHGGIWTMCISLSNDEIKFLEDIGFPQKHCINYLTPQKYHDETRVAWQSRMQNLSISCSLVCLVILGSAVLLGLFGLCKHQISAVLITGVMYLLAATFALFTVTIIHFKRIQDRGKIFDGPEDGVIGDNVPKSILKARRCTTSWSMDFGWGGVTLCTLASVAWFLLSKIMRFSPITSGMA